MPVVTVQEPCLEVAAAVVEQAEQAKHRLAKKAVMEDQDCHLLFQDWLIIMQAVVAAADGKHKLLVLVESVAVAEVQHAAHLKIPTLHPTQVVVVVALKTDTANTAATAAAE